VLNVVSAGLSSRVHDVLELLSVAAVRGSARLRLPAATVSSAVPYDELSVRLRVRLDDTEAEGLRADTVEQQARCHGHADCRQES